MLCQLKSKKAVAGFALFLFSIAGVFSQNFRGVVTDAESGDPLVGACLLVKPTAKGTCTDENGIFTFQERLQTPFEVEVTFVGYNALTLTIDDLSKEHDIKLSEGLNLETVEVVSDHSQLKRELSLTVESIGLQEIRSVSEASFYDALASMRETDLLTVSFGVKVINARGFNSSTPIRSLQLIDGVDNASPGLNYPLGNFMGMPDLDAEGVDLVIGASSAYFGPGAFNGVINMRSKSPFKYPGIEIELKAGERNYLDGSMRAAKVFKNKEGKNKLGLKLAFSYSRVNDWEADDHSPSIDAMKDSVYQDNPGGYDAVNRYGDEVSGNYTSLFEQFRHPGLSRFYRTGYWEKDLADYDSYNMKVSGAAHYLVTPDWEVIASTNYGTGTTVMQLDNRLSLNDVWAMQNKFEVRNSDRFFFRFYTTREDAGDTYDIVSTGNILQNRWKGDGTWLNDYKNYWFSNINSKVKQLPGFPTIGPPPDFFYDFDKAREVIAMNYDSIYAWHQRARASQDGLYLVPGTPEFDTVFQDIISTKVSEGGTKYVDRSRLYHGHTQYKFKPRFVDEITVGGNYRLYTPDSEGTIFADTLGTKIKTYEYGMYVGVQKTVLDDRLRLNVATRVDKHQNYDYLVSPAFSAQYLMSERHSMRFSVSSALRNPTLIEQYYYFRVGSALLLGNINGYENLITLKSFETYLDSNLNKSLLVYFDEDPIKPEKAFASELAYSGLFFDYKLDVKATLYLNRYKDFIGYKIGLDVPFFMGFPGVPIVYRFAANAKDITYTTGFSAGATYYLNQNLGLSGNYSWNRIIQKSDDPLIPAYNTPEHKFNVGVDVRDLKIGKTEGWSAGVDFRWVEGYTFESSPQFTGSIPAQYYLNGQVSKHFEKIKSTIKLSGSNLLDRRQNGLYGGPAIGRFLFVSWYFAI